MKVYCFASHWDGNAQHLVNSMRNAKLDYHIELAHPYSWFWTRMVDFEWRMARQHPNEWMIFIDLWDSIFVGDADEMWADIQDIAKNRPFLHSDKACWPRPEQAYMFPPCASPWKYVNGSGPFGMGWQIAEAIDYGMRNYPIRPKVTGVHPHDYPRNDNDQRFWTDLYLDGYVGVDTECRVVQGLPLLKPGELEYRDGRIHNTVTGTRPHFLHAADHTWPYIPQEVIDDKSLRPRK